MNHHTDFILLEFFLFPNHKTQTKLEYSSKKNTQRTKTKRFFTHDVTLCWNDYTNEINNSFSLIKTQQIRMSNWLVVFVDLFLYMYHIDK